MATAFQGLAERGQLNLTDPAMAANQVVGMLLWIPVNKAKFTGNDNAVTNAELKHYAQSATRTFLTAHAPATPRRPSARTQGQKESLNMKSWQSPSRADPRAAISTGQQTAWPTSGPASYFPSIEKNYGRSIADWQDVIRKSGLEKHMEIVGHLKSEYGIGHGHANALVGWTLRGNVA